MAKIATISVPGAKALYSKTVLDSNFSAVNNNFLNFLHLAGTSEASNSMTGDLDMGGKEIINSVAPSAPGSLATKGYVDQTLTIGSTTGTIGSLVVDVDGDTKVDTESSADIDRLDLLAATSGGGSAGIRIVGNDAAASSLTNPFIEIKKHVVLDADVRIGDAVAANTYIELTDTSSPDTIFMVAGGNAVFDLSSTAVLVSQNIEMAVGKKVGDLDNDTYIVFNEGSDDDTVRIYAGGVEKVTITSSSVSIGIDAVSGNFAVGGSVNPTGATKAIQMITGTSATTASDLTDNQVGIYSTVVSGIENKLNFDFKGSGPVRKTVVLGFDCVFPNDVSVGNDLTVTGDIAPASLSGTIGGTPNISTAWTFSGVPVFSGATSFTGAPTFSGLPVFSNVSGLSTDDIVERTGAEGVTIDGVLLKDSGIKTDSNGTNEVIRTKVLDIDDWDMSAATGTGTITVTHGLTLAKIRQVNALIRRDDDASYFSFLLGESVTEQNNIQALASNIQLTRAVGGQFDNVNFNSTSFNRGWITITYAV